MTSASREVPAIAYALVLMITLPFDSTESLASCRTILGSLPASVSRPAEPEVSLEPLKIPLAGMKPRARDVPTFSNLLIVRTKKSEGVGYGERQARQWRDIAERSVRLMKQ
ncbi:hypothetical protein HHA04nite_20080 [Halomonas halophila]|uniref:Uncharacterized protein n=1 Tax=Halomonas halophila TaxID=29573 RepID=A0ABQ0U4J9_9GAMM|nr:hypothetical protein HHA04nite_20080 [Halomonas halophila]